MQTSPVMIADNGAMGMGVTAAQTAAMAAHNLGLPNNAAIRFRNAANDAWASILSYSPDNVVEFANAGVGLSIQPALEINMPSQPSFYAYNSAHDLNVTGQATAFTVIFDTEKFDQGADFDGVSTFTAPVDGVYTFKLCILTGDTAGTTGSIRINTSNQSHYGQRLHPENCDQPDNELAWAMAVDCWMDANDTATVIISLSGAGSNVVDVYGSASHGYTWFSGALLC